MPMKFFRRSNRRRPQPLIEPGRNNDQALLRMTPPDDTAFHSHKKKALYSVILILLFFSAIMARLWRLQVEQGAYYSKQADSNRVRYLELVAPRGNISDRRGREMVTNRPSFNVMWLRENNKLDDEWLKTLTTVLGQDSATLLEKIRKMSGQPGHLPVRLAEDIDWEKVAHIEVNRMYLPEIKIEVAPLRVYHYGDRASHLLGYLGQINERELEQLNKDIPENLERNRYRGGDLTGKAGLELFREQQLRGIKGRDYMEVDALGFEQQTLKGERPIPGNDLQLTLDLDLQTLAEDEMAKNNYAGAVVAMEANTGRLLTLVSAPTLRIQDFVGGISQANWKAMQEDPLHPLVNKLVQGQYPPGSTYKPITAIAGLAEGIITPQTTFFCPGSYRFGNRTYRCWNKRGHGSVSLKRAVAESCDVYFYQVGQRLGVDRLAKYAHLFGLGAETGVEMEHEKPGIVPSTSWKKKRYGQKWHEGETLSVAIGQGYNLVTPVQLALMTAAVANGGTLYKPSVIEKSLYPDGTVAESFTPHVLHRFTGNGAHLKLVRDGMVEAVNGARGTGRKAQIGSKGIVVGGKTGTAQVVRLEKYKHLKEKNIPYKYRDHAWFTCFAPASNPEIVVTVLVEHGLHGGSAAAPIAAKILSRYFEDKFKERLRKEKDQLSPEEQESGSVVFPQEGLEDTDAPGQDDEGEQEGTGPAPGDDNNQATPPAPQ